MPKVNSENLDGQIQEIIIKQLIYSITYLESPKQTAAFFSDFLTDAETIMLSKRLSIAILLLRGHSQTLITKILSVSYSATGAVSSWLKNADPATMVLLNTISQSDDWKELVYNHKLVNKSKNVNSRATKELNQPASSIKQHSEFAPASLSDALETGDYSSLEGPSLVDDLDATDTIESAGPSMDDLLEDI